MSSYTSKYKARISSSPTAKATEKEHKGNKEGNYNPCLRSIAWTEEWAKNNSEIVRVDELFKLTKGDVFGLEKRITKSLMSQTKAELWEVLKVLAPLDCLSMQADVKSFYRKFPYNLDMKFKKYSKNTKDWYTKKFCFSTTTKKTGHKV